MLNIEIKIQLHNIKKNITLQFSKQLMKYDIKTKHQQKLKKNYNLFTH